MTKDLEDYLWNNIDHPKKFARDVIDEMLTKGMINNPKQAWATLKKWDRQGKYEWGVSLLAGWKVKD